MPKDASRSLHIGDTKRGRFTLPIDAVTQTFAILAKRGAGKTYAARVMVEELHAAGLPVVVVDPIGVCWGLRSSSDGKKPGLSIIVMGGDHGDVPLESTAGTVIADFVVTHRSSCVLDLSHMRKAESVRFMTDFAERLFRKNRNPLHLILDEADAFAPQSSVKGDKARMLGAVEDLVRRGRARGLGLTLVTQRAAVLNKNVLTQIDTLLVLRTISPQDRAAMDEWIKSHDSHDRREEFMASLPSLGIGEAWIWSPGGDLDCFDRVKIRQTRTFDSSATPKPGARRVEPKRMAAVDLEALKGRIAETIERAKADDPAELHRQIRELKLAAKARPAAVDRTSIDRAVAAAVEKAERRAAKRDAQYHAAFDAFRAQIRRARDVLSENGAKVPEKVEWTPPATSAGRAKPAQIIPNSMPVVHSNRRKCPAPQEVEGRRLTKAERAVLAAIASRRPRPMKARAVALIAGYSPKSGSFRNTLSTLRTSGLIDGGRDALRLGEAGFDLDHAPVLTGDALLSYWLGRLHKAARSILEAVAKAFPDALTKSEIADRTEYSPTSGSFRNALSKLRTAELIEGYDDIKAAETLFE